MDAKLTLKLNKEVIEKAKKYAADKKMSLSRIIESYLKSLTSEKDTDHLEVSLFIKSIATGSNIPTDLDAKKEYAEYLEKKYK